jgi:hypothetical protein
VPNQQVTQSFPNMVWSEVTLAINPRDATQRVVAAKWLNVSSDECTVLPLYLDSSGARWTAVAIPLPFGATGSCNASLAWGDGSDVFLAVSALTPASGGTGAGVYVYRSSDAGQTWSAPVAVPDGVDFPSLAFDPTRHTLYLVARDAAWYVTFAQSSDGATWEPPLRISVATSPLPSAPSIAVGTSQILAVWTADFFVTTTWSSDGGQTFSYPLLTAPRRFPGPKLGRSLPAHLRAVVPGREASVQCKERGRRGRERVRGGGGRTRQAAPVAILRLCHSGCASSSWTRRASMVSITASESSSGMMLLSRAPSARQRQTSSASCA